MKRTAKNPPCQFDTDIDKIDTEKAIMVNDGKQQKALLPFSILMRWKMRNDAKLYAEYVTGAFDVIPSCVYLVISIISHIYLSLDYCNTISLILEDRFNLSKNSQLKNIKTIINNIQLLFTFPL